MKGRSKGRPALAPVGEIIKCTSCGDPHAKRAKTNKCEPCRKKNADESIAKSVAKKAEKVAANKGWNHEMSGKMLSVSLRVNV